MMPSHHFRQRLWLQRQHMQQMQHTLAPMPLLSILLMLLALALGSIAQAAVPHESAKPAYAEEQTILQSEKDVPEPGFGSAKSGRNHFDRHFIIPPGYMPEQDVILQRGGNTWRHLRNGPMAAIAGTILLVVPLLIFGFYRAVGPAAESRGGGREIQRFTSWDRTVHWATAITFIILGVSGLIVMFGKKVILPWLGHSAYYWVALISKYLHNFVGPLFIVCSLLMFFTFLSRNVFRRWDWQWIKRGGGLIRHEHIPAGFFNAGEKIWFWGGVTLLGLLMSITGLMLNFPYFKNIGENIGLTRYLLQVADYLHIIGATLYIAAAMGHIYIGTWGTPGAYHAMRHGTVNEEWAQAHHELWYNELRDGHAGAPPHQPLPPGAPTHPRI
ncbi:formate dehydrogenase subunit gamma [Noviherbaspirillum malthae]|jgi:formate dehydrogenase subunit gamma|uniref:formate dehydrogenase subunit gamma n=1 Tax=Noviherbaspirillum malthae TaxID=1260987 RepID=UPI001E551F90|nr:formate dehydrogenase subunit gamma [Noviherbaspirillum malthae]